MFDRPLESLIDLDRYPIDRPGTPAYAALVETGRAALDDSGYCAVPDLLRPTALNEMAAEARAALPHGYRRDQQLAAYHSVDIADLPDDHPARRRHPYCMRVIAQDDLPADGAILSLYRSDALAVFIASLLREPALFRCTDPLVSCTVTALEPGDQHGWHFDSNDFVASLLLQSAEIGGAFEFAPGIRHDDNPNYAAIARIYDGERSLLQATQVSAGTLVLFRGKYALHRVSQVGGSRPRLMALFSYDRRPDMVFPEQTRLAAVGRAS